MEQKYYLPEKMTWSMSINYNPYSYNFSPVNPIYSILHFIINVELVHLYYLLLDSQLHLPSPNYNLLLRYASSNWLP